MKTFMRILCLSGVLTGCGMLTPSAWAQNISTVSPFLPRGGPGAGAATPNSPIELRGITTTSEGILFCLFDPVQKKGGIVKLNEAGRDFLVRTYDAANDAVSVEYQGRTLNLALKSAKIETMPAVALAGPPRPATGPQVGPTPSADDARRVEAVAAEVARRRQARQAALQQQQPPPQQQQPQPNRQR